MPLKITFLEHPLILRLRAASVLLCVLLMVGILTRPIEAPAWQEVKSAQPEMNLDAIEESLGQGLVIGILGGFRTLLANLFWIQANVVWEQHDRVELDAMIRLVTTLDPRPEFFWLNSARMVAYDVPTWRIREEGGFDLVPEARQQAIDLEQAEQAFALLRTALEYHPENPRIYLDFAQIYLNRLKDNENAAKWYLKASNFPDAPFYAARIYAELLKRMGRDEKAYAFLRELHAQLPDDNPLAHKPIILERIRDLEDKLGIPDAGRYTP
ncbi:MAG: tetratricopeptide repeat protein [Verrucomicrobiota bacterium]